MLLTAQKPDFVTATRFSNDLSRIMDNDEYVRQNIFDQLETSNPFQGKGHFLPFFEGGYLDFSDKSRRACSDFFVRASDITGPTQLIIG